MTDYLNKVNTHNRFQALSEEPEGSYIGDLPIQIN